MLRTLTMRAKVMGSYIIVFILMFIALGVALSGMLNVGDKFDHFFEQTYARQTAYQQMFADGLLSGVALRNLVLKPHLKKPYKVTPKAIERFDQAYKNAMTLAGNDTAIKASLNEIDQYWQKSRAAKFQVLELMKAGKRDEAISVLGKQEHPNWQKVRIAAQKLYNDEVKNAADLRADMLASKQGTLRNSLILAAVAVVIGAIIAFLIVQGIRKAFCHVVTSLNDIASGEGDLTRRLDESRQDEVGQVARAFNRFVAKIQDLVAQVSDSIHQLAGASKQMSEVSGTTMNSFVKQQGEIEQVATAMNQMTATVQEVARNADDASTAAKAADNESSAGNLVVQEVIQAINELANEVASTSETIHHLDGDTEQIGTVLDVIKNIAEQTNLLALNAAIEAARAGEQGRGFAVVADEVRTLASRTQQSTQEIQEMIERLQSGAKNAVNAMERGQKMAAASVEKAEQAGSSLSGITGAVSQIADMNTQIATAAEEQSEVADSINRNVVAINDLSMDATGGAEQIATASADLEQLSERLQDIVGSFKVR
jgi:methyl-accepting chemotaxis protein